jgi:hypothetical protein
VYLKGIFVQIRLRHRGSFDCKLAAPTSCTFITNRGEEETILLQHDFHSARFFVFVFFACKKKKKMRRLQPGVPMLLQLYGLISENCVPPVLVINVYQLSEPEKLCTVLGKKNELRKIR